MKSEQFKAVLDDVKHEILMEIMKNVRKTEDNRIEVRDASDLITKDIDFSTAEIVHSIEFEEDGSRGGLIANLGVYEEEYCMPVDTFDVEFLIKILKACEAVTV